MYIAAGRDVWSGLEVTVLVGNGVGQSLWMNSTFWCVNWVLARKWWVLAFFSHLCFGLLFGFLLSCYFHLASF